MSFLSIFRGVAAKIVTVPLIAFVLGLWIPGLLGYQLLQRGVERETHEKAQTILELLSAVQHYADEESGAQVVSDKGSTSHTSAYVTRQVLQRYETNHHGDTILYRQAALTP